MTEKRRVFTAELRERAVRIVPETGKPIPEVAQDLEINETTLANRVSRARQAGNGRERPGHERGVGPAAGAGGLTRL
ncbi:transposase [Streptomyces sp. NPDC102282]|uniref:transposase n=1 Tax=Streptomyces sp. NPDC102282 TaxID=3366154 RepID=UPI0038205158